MRTLSLSKPDLSHQLTEEVQSDLAAILKAKYAYDQRNLYLHPLIDKDVALITFL